MPTQTLGSLLQPFVVAGADWAANWTVDHEAQLVSLLQGYEAKGIDALAADLETAIPTQSVEEKIVAPEFKAAIKNLATEVIGQLPNLNREVIDKVINGLTELAARFAGTPTS